MYDYLFSNLTASLTTDHATNLMFEDLFLSFRGKILTRLDLLDHLNHVKTAMGLLLHAIFFLVAIIPPPKNPPRSFLGHFDF